MEEYNIPINCFKTRQGFDNFLEILKANRDYVELNAIHQHIIAICKMYYSICKDSDIITTEGLSKIAGPYYNKITAGNPPQEELDKITEEFKTTFNIIRNQPAPTITEASELLGRYNESLLPKRVQGLLINTYEDKKFHKFLPQLNNLIDSSLKTSPDSGNVSRANIWELLDTKEQSSYTWTVSCLNEQFKRLGAGTFGVFAAITNKGKTSFLLSQAIHWATELKDDERILWISTEGAATDQKIRMYSSITGLTPEQMYEKGREGVVDLEQQVSDYFNGDKNKIIFSDCREGANTTKIQEYILKFKPKILIVDMLWHIKSSKATSEVNGLEDVGRCMRDFAVKYDMMVIGTAQIGMASYEDASRTRQGDMSKLNALYKSPPLSSLYYSKTALQGSADWVVFMGINPNEQEFPNERYLSVKKLKEVNKNSTITSYTQFNMDFEFCKATDLVAPKSGIVDITEKEEEEFVKNNVLDNYTEDMNGLNESQEVDGPRSGDNHTQVRQPSG